MMTCSFVEVLSNESLISDCDASEIMKFIEIALFRCLLKF